MPQVWDSGELGYSVHSCQPQNGTQVTLEGEDVHLSNNDSNFYIPLLNSHIGIMSIIFYELLIDSLSVTYAWSDFYLHSCVDYKSLLFSLRKWEKGKMGSKTLKYVLCIPSIPKSASKLLSYMKTQICKNLQEKHSTFHKFPDILLLTNNTSVSTIKDLENTSGNSALRILKYFCTHTQKSHYYFFSLEALHVFPLSYSSMIYYLWPPAF